MQAEDNPNHEMMNINKLYGWQNPHQCSYCKKGQTSTWSFSKQSMFPKTYQIMMERGWRRCGDYYYKNDMAKNCCKQWTIRQDVTRYRMKKDQKKTIKKMMALAYECNQVIAENPPKISEVQEGVKLQKSKGKITLEVRAEIKDLMLNICKRINEQIKEHIRDKIPEEEKKKFTFDVLQKLKYFASDPNAKGDYYCNYVMLLFGINKKCFQKDYSISNFVTDMKNTIEKLGTTEDSKVHVEKNGYLVFILHEKYKKDKSNEFQIIEIDEQQIMKDQKQEQVKKAASKQAKEKGTKKKPESKTQMKNPDNSKKDSECLIIKPIYKGEITITTDEIRFGKLRVAIVPVEESNESWKLYQKYCEHIHEKKQKKMSSYINFLCTNGLTSQTQTGNPSESIYIPSWDPTQQYQTGKKIGSGVKKRLGCFHMKYYLEDKFIGVGVVDIVPSGLSSVYFFYDPDYKDFRLGVFSSVIEIEYIRFLSKVFPEFKYYYMGFYIQNNEKMNYKSDYQPCELLCPETYSFVELSPELKTHVDKILSKEIISVRLAPLETQIIPDMTFGQDIGVYIDRNLKLTYQGQKLTLSQINPKFFVPVLRILKTYIQVWGKEIFEILTFTF